MNITRLQNLDIVHRSRAWLLRRKLATDYQTYLDLRADASCGVALHKTMSPTFCRVCDRLNKTLDELAKLDNNTPTTRF